MADWALCSLSAISYQIKKLEQQLNITIFDRSGYRAELTPAGNALWREGQRMLSLANRIETLSERFAEGWEPRLDVVIDGDLAYAIGRDKFHVVDISSSEKPRVLGKLTGVGEARQLEVRDGTAYIGSRHDGFVHR